MDLDDIFGREPTIIDLQAKERWEAIDELIGNLVAIRKINPEHSASILTAVKKRESSMSTGIGFGIALPHASTDLVTEFVQIVGRSKSGIPFDALDEQPAKLVMLFLVPQAQFASHLQILANVAKLLHSTEFRDELWRRFL